jgi:hypothetical protein
MQGIKSTSMVYKNCHDVIQREPYVLFCDEDENACHLEIYPRNNGEIYVCGCGGSDIIGEKYYDCIMSNLIVTE